MVLSPEARVGTISIVGLLVAAMVIVYVGGLHVGPRGYNVKIRLRDARGLEEGAAVRMSGVKVGQVESVTLTREAEEIASQALVTVKLKKGVELWNSFAIQVAKGGLLGEYYIDITPIRTKKARLVKANATLTGQVQPQLEDLIPQASLLLAELQGLAGNINSLTQDEKFVFAIKKAVIDLGATAAAIRNVIANPAVGRAMTASAVNVQAATAHGATAARNIADATKEFHRVNNLLRTLESMATENRKEIAGILANLETTTANLGEISDAFRWLAAESGTKENMQQTVASLSETAKNVEESTAVLRNMASDETIQKDLKISLENLRKSLENVEASTAAFKDLATDQQVQTDLRDTLRNTSDAVKTVKQAVSGATKPLRALAEVKATPDIRTWYSPALNRAFTDFNLRLTGMEDSFLDLGIHDIGDRDRLNLQGGILRGPLSYRFGLYRSELWMGMDYRIGDIGSLSFNAYEPNDLNLNLWSGWRLNDHLNLMLGIEDIANRRVGGVGIQFSR